LYDKHKLDGMKLQKFDGMHMFVLSGQAEMNFSKTEIRHKATSKQNY